MVARAIECNEQVLRQIVNDDVELSPDSPELKHIESCVFCQQSLERMAGDPSWWSGARCLLDTDCSQGEAITELHDPGRPARFDEPKDQNARADESHGAVARRDDRATDLFFLTPSDDDSLLGQFDGYDVESVIGRGGMGIVLKARDRELNRLVAIKILAPHLASSGAARQRFLREARAAAAVVHEHVVAIHGISQEADFPYLVMPYVAGTSLQAHVDHQGPLDVSDTLRISMQIAMGLSAAHNQGLVHRDVKPANILLEHGLDRVMITDFGLARAADDASLTCTGVIAGTPHYMSPEQASGGAVDGRSDLFGLGSVMYFMLTGRPAFRADSTLAVLDRIRNSEPRDLRQVNPQVPKWLARIVDRLLSKRPAQRYSDANEVVELLAAGLTHLQQPSQSAAPYVRPRRNNVRHLVLGSAAATLILLVAAGILSSVGPASIPAPNSEGQPATSSPGVASENVPALQPLDQWDRELNELNQQSSSFDGTNHPYAMGFNGPADVFSTWDAEAASLELWIQGLEARIQSEEYERPFRQNRF